MIPYLNTAIVKVLGILAIGIAIGLTINSWRLGAQIAELKDEHSQQMTDIANAASNAARHALEQQQRSYTAMAELDRKYTDEIEQAQLKTDQLRNAVASGERRLRIQASCPVPADRVPDAGAAPRVDDDSGPRLTDAAERYYWQLRDRITVVTTQVSALQAYINQSCVGSKQ